MAPRVLKTTCVGALRRTRSTSCLGLRTWSALPPRSKLKLCEPEPIIYSSQQSEGLSFRKGARQAFPTDLRGVVSPQGPPLACLNRRLDKRTGVRVEHTFVSDRVSSHPWFRAAGGAAGATCAHASACGARSGGGGGASARARDGGCGGGRHPTRDAAGGGALTLPGSCARRAGSGNRGARMGAALEAARGLRLCCRSSRCRLRLLRDARNRTPLRRPRAGAEAGIGSRRSGV